MPALDASETSAPVVAEAGATAFDLAQLDTSDKTIDWSVVRKRCDYAAARPGEIVVCAPDPDAERLGELRGLNGYEPPPETTGLPRAAWKLNDSTTLDVHVESQTMPGGVVSNRAMVGLKIAF